VARNSRPRPTRPNRPAAARAGSVSTWGGRPLFLEPLDQGVAADLEDAGDAAHGGALLVSGQDQCLELGGVPAFGGIGEGTTALFAAVAVMPSLGVAEADNLLALAIGAGDNTGNHDRSLQRQLWENHYHEG